MAVSGRGNSGAGGIGKSQVKASARRVTGPTQRAIGFPSRGMALSGTKDIAFSRGAADFSNALTPGMASVAPQGYICPTCKETRTITLHEEPKPPRCVKCDVALVREIELARSSLGAKIPKILRAADDLKVEPAPAGQTGGRDRTGKRRKHSS